MTRHSFTTPQLLNIILVSGHYLRIKGGWFLDHMQKMQFPIQEGAVVIHEFNFLLLNQCIVNEIFAYFRKEFALFTKTEPYFRVR